MRASIKSLFLQRKGAFLPFSFNIENVEITAVEVQKKNKERVSLFLDYQFWIGISLELFQELEIHKGMIIDKKEKQKIETLATEDKAFYSALQSLSYKDYSQTEIERKLKEKGFPKKAINKALERCTSLKLIDDLAYARNVAFQKKNSGQGKRRVWQYLKQAGIDESEIKATIEEIFIDEEEAEEAHLVLTRKYRSKLTPEDALRAQNFLLRRGFSFLAATKAVAREKMSDEEQEISYGPKQALEKLRRRWPNQESFEERKAWRFLVQKGFSNNSAKEAIRLYSSSK